ncbi:peptide transporter permease SapC [Streptomyces sp. NPDC002328]|uniref:peptide transporter permease SapC n=1 Tax=Streptomyces sp. NPDC002328 TaxID=3364642 RepID=UPI0036BCC4AE
MKLTIAVLTAGVAMSLTTAVVGAARLRQNARHQAEQDEALLTENQIDWLTRMSANPDLAKLWKPADMEAEEYTQLMSANRLICTLSLRDRLGFVPEGDLRAQEAEGDGRAERFTNALDRAAQAHLHERPAAI